MDRSEYARRNSSPAPELRAAVAAMSAGLPAGSLVVDVGCGPGREIRLLREQGLRVVGLDLSMAQLRAGSQSGVAQADMRRLPLPTGGVRAVWCQAALLHIPRAEVPGVLHEFARVVTGGGELNLSVAEGDGDGWEVASNYGSSRRRWFTYHRLPDLTDLLVDAGFEVQDVRRAGSARDWIRVRALVARR